MSVVVLDPQAEAYVSHLAPRFTDMCFTADIDPAKPGAAVRAADVLITFGIGIPPDLLSACPELKWIQALSTGVDQFAPLLSAAGNDILLTSTRGVHAPPVSEFAMLHMLALARDLSGILRAQALRRWDRNPGILLSGKTVGVAGVGVIGLEILRKCRMFGMTTVGFGSSARTLPEADRFHAYDALADEARDLDFLVMVAPLAPHTRNLVNHRVLAAMKSTAFLINVGRGGTVDEEALITALQEGRIAGAGLDTVQSEPLAENSPLWGMPNVIITPHVAANTQTYIADVCNLIADNITAFRSGTSSAMRNLIPRNTFPEA